MAVREDLVSSAVTFLQDPSVANAPLDKRVAFLQSKNMTQDEIDIALSRAAGSSSQSPPSVNYNVQPQYRNPPPQYGYQQYPPEYWRPPPEVPRRDWRDYFIMATVMSGLSYGVYFIAKRYIVPLIAPPTPPQLESDKAAIDEAFERAFSLIEQLSNDTAAIKASEEQRKERLDSALADVEAAMVEMKNSTRRREDDSRRISDEVQALHTAIPRSIKAHEEATDARLKELGAELKSLKTLLSNRVGGQAPSPGATQRGTGVNGGTVLGSHTASTVNGIGASTANADSALTNHNERGAKSPERSSTPTSMTTYGRASGAKGGIPEWQMAASKKPEPDNIPAAAGIETHDAAASGTS